MQIGEHIKIHLRGEAPWGCVKDIRGDCVAVVIDNHLVNTDEHGWKYGDTLTVERDQENGGWTPTRQQITWFGKGHPDCADCHDGYCTLNCSPRR